MSTPITDTDRLNWIEQQLKPGCFCTINHHQHASQFWGSPPHGWSADKPVSFGEFPETFGANLRDAIDSALANDQGQTRSAGKTNHE